MSGSAAREGIRHVADRAIQHTESLSLHAAGDRASTRGAHLRVVKPGGHHGNAIDAAAGTKRHAEASRHSRRTPRLRPISLQRCARRPAQDGRVDRETLAWSPRPRARRRDPRDMVHIRIDYLEAALRERVKAAGGIRRPRQRLWEVEWKTVLDPGSQARVADNGSTWNAYAFRYPDADAYGYTRRFPYSPAGFRPAQGNVHISLGVRG